ncbi:MAG: aminodeoxychorismate/anthranilate synthase component II [Alphaproteobacteria bacterium]|nr:MAG: aminodeoxychorismate/anthranilate synthase component II [Alphaproteobacteria bacterium]
MITLIDNYDSFTYNLVHFLGELGAKVKVYRNNVVSVDDVFSENPAGIVLSPGPCDPDKAGICLELVKRAAVEGMPILGVCLGHQTIGQVFGGKVVRANQLMHGKTSKIHHNGEDVFEGLPDKFIATRYHSLTIAPESVPDSLKVTATTEDGVIMGLSHETLPLHGVQFHPESIASEHGHRLLENFLTLTGPESKVAA